MSDIECQEASIHEVLKGLLSHAIRGDEKSYQMCVRPLPLCNSTSFELQNHSLPGRLQQTTDNVAKLIEPVTSSPIFNPFLLIMGLFLMLSVSRYVVARAQRKRTIRHLVDIHPCDRSAEVKRLADKEGILSMYREEGFETYTDAVDEKEKLAGVGP